MIEAILQGNEALRTQVRLFTASECQDRWSRALELMRVAEAWTANAINTESLSTPEVKAWLRSCPVPDQSVTAVWMADRDALAVDWKTVCEAYDQFWYPSRDDVVLFGEEPNWILLLDHEEIFTFRAIALSPRR